MVLLGTIDDVLSADVIANFAVVELLSHSKEDDCFASRRIDWLDLRFDFLGFGFSATPVV